MICNGCNEFKPIEHKDLGLCATCNKAHRKAGTVKVAKQPQPLKRTALKPSTKKPKQVSDKHKSILEQERELHAAMDAEGITWCETCGRTDKPLSRSHIIPKGMYPDCRLIRENLLYECYGDSTTCHYIWENCDMEQLKQQKTWQRKVGVIMKYKPEFYELLLLNRTSHSTLVN